MADEVDKPFKPEDTDPDVPTDITPNPKVPAKGTPAAPADQVGQVRSSYTPPPPKRTSEQIRADIEDQRKQLGQNVDHLRDRVTEITDWRGQIKKHKKKIVVGAVATGFVVGGLMALRRR